MNVRKLLAAAALAVSGTAALTAVSAPAHAGGCVAGVCGIVDNQSGLSITVTTNWNDGSNTFRNVSWSPPGQHSVPRLSQYGGNGVDVDGFKVPARCSAYVTYNGVNPQTLTAGWYKFSNQYRATIVNLRCEA